MPVDLPAADDAAGLPEYTDAVVAAIGDRAGLVLVAQSLGAFTAPLVCERVPVDLLVLLNPMIPAPGESADGWWANTGQAAARAERAARDGRTASEDIDPMEDFFHDFPPAVTGEAVRQGAPRQSGTVSGSRGRCGGGRPSRRACCRAAPTGSSRRSSSAGWRNPGSASSPRRCRAGTCSPSAGRSSWPTG